MKEVWNLILKYIFIRLIMKRLFIMWTGSNWWRWIKLVEILHKIGIYWRNRRLIWSLYCIMDKLHMSGLDSAG